MGCVLHVEQTGISGGQSVGCSGQINSISKDVDTPAPRFWEEATSRAEGTEGAGSYGREVGNNPRFPGCT